MLITHEKSTQTSNHISRSIVFIALIAALKSSQIIWDTYHSHHMALCSICPYDCTIEEIAINRRHFARFDLNPAWPSDVIWERIWPTSIKKIVWGLVAPNHYLNQCGLIFRGALVIQLIPRYQSLMFVWKIHIQNHSYFSQGQWVGSCPWPLSQIYPISPPKELWKHI